LGVQSIENVSGLEIGQTKARYDVGATDYQDAQVHKKEQRLEASRQRRDNDDDGKYRKLNPPEHG